MEEYYNYKKNDYSQLYKDNKIDKKFHLLLNEYFSRRAVEMDFWDEESIKDAQNTMSNLNSIKFKKSHNKKNNVVAYYRRNKKSIVLYENKCSTRLLFVTLAHELGHINDNTEAFIKNQSSNDSSEIKGNNIGEIMESAKKSFSALKNDATREILWSLPFNEIYTENKAYRLDSEKDYFYGNKEIISTDGYPNLTPIMLIMSSITGIGVQKLLKKSENEDESFEKIVLDNCDNKDTAQYCIDTMAANTYMLSKIIKQPNVLENNEKKKNLNNAINCIHRSSVGILVERMKSELPNVNNENFSEYIEKIKFSINSINLNIEECGSIGNSYFSVANSESTMYVKKIVQNLENVDDLSKLSVKDEINKIFTVTNKEIEEFRDIDKNKQYYDISDEIKDQCLELKKANNYDNTEINTHINNEFKLGQFKEKNKIFNVFKKQKKEPLYLNAMLRKEMPQNTLIRNLSKLVNNNVDMPITNVNDNLNTKYEDIDPADLW